MELSYTISEKVEGKPQMLKLSPVFPVVRAGTVPAGNVLHWPAESRTLTWPVGGAHG